MKTQICPNCQRVHDVGVYVSGQRVLCRCGIRFEVRRQEVSMIRGDATRLGRGATALRLAETAPEGPVALEAAPQTPPAPDENLATGATFLRPASAGPHNAETLPELNLPGLELLEVLGRGGMGEVWRARQRSLGRTVAVKLLPPKLAKDPEFVARFEKESAALAALSHPHIIQIFDRGVSDEHYYFVMEYVEGKSLRESMGTQGLPLREVLSVVSQIARALECAHSSGVIHRDLKPENILLDARGHLKVADFGLAGFRGANSQHQLTGSAVAMGTLNYMAPEQRRDAKKVDGRADLFSLGVLFYELLTGELPIGRFKMPSERVPGTDPRVDVIVARLLENEAEARYASALELLEALEPLAASSSAKLLLAQGKGADAAATSPPSFRRRSVTRSLETGWKGLRGGLALVGGLALLGVSVRFFLGPLRIQGGRDAGQAVQEQPWPANTNSELFSSLKDSPATGNSRQLELAFEGGKEEINAWAGSWRLDNGQLSVEQGGSDSGGGRLIPRAYLAHRYFSADDFNAEVLMEVKPLGKNYPFDEEAQHFGELAFRIKNLQVSAFAIPGVGMRLSWRYTRKDGVEVVGNSAQDLYNLVEDEMPLPQSGPFLVRLHMKKRPSGIEVEAFLNNQRFARKLLPGLEGRVGKVALGCRNLACTFDDLKVRGEPMPRPKRELE